MKYIVEINDIDGLIEKFEPWAGAEDTVNEARRVGRENDLFDLIEETFGDTTPTQTEVNDFIWHEARDIMGLFEDNGEEPETDEPDEDSDQFGEENPNPPRGDEQMPLTMEQEVKYETPVDDDFNYDDLPESIKNEKPAMNESVVRGDDVNDEEKPFYGVVGIKQDGTAVAVGIFTSVDDATDAGTQFVDDNGADAVDFDIFGADSEKECEDEFTFRMFN